MVSGKGSSFEREMSRYLSKWWTNGERDDIFWRNRVKVTSKTPNAERQLGDITAFHTLGLPFVEMFNIELKIGYSHKSGGRKIAWDLLDVIDSKKTDDNLLLINFWKQCLSDAELSNRIPILIFKRDMHKPVVCINTDYFSEIKNYLGKLCVKNIIFNYKDVYSLRLYDMEDFFNWMTPEIIKHIHRLLNNGK
jgi:hypothetical protein